MVPELTDRCEEPGLADVPVLAFVSDVAQETDLRKELLQEADGLVVAEVLGPYLQMSGFSGKSAISARRSGSSRCR